MTTEDSLFQRFGREFPRGTVLFREGEPGGEMYVVQRGRVRVSRRIGDVEQVLSTFGAGEFFGEMAILSGKPRTATATCAEDAKLLVVDGKTFEAMLRANGEISVRMIRKLAERLARANDQIETLLLPDVSVRACSWLVALADRDPGTQRVAASLSDLAARVAAGRTQLDSVAAKLVRAGVATCDGNVVEVHDVARLRRYLELMRLKTEFGETP